MKASEANEIIAEYVGNFSCHDCTYHEYEQWHGGEGCFKCTKDGYYFEDIDECGQFMLDAKNQRYADSLDALIPVWGKLGHPLVYFEVDYHIGKHITTVTTAHEISDGEGYGETIQEAACIATAKAIQELKDKQ